MCKRKVFIGVNRFVKSILLAIAFIVYASSTLFAADVYVIEAAHDDDVFIINGEKFEAQTFCLGWDEGERVIFLDGSPFGACASATLYNVDKKEKCDVWCE